MNPEDQRNRTSTACLVRLQPVAELVRPSLNEKTVKHREGKKLDRSHIISYETEQSAHTSPGPPSSSSWARLPLTSLSTGEGTATRPLTHLWHLVTYVACNSGSRTVYLMNKGPSEVISFLF